MKYWKIWSIYTLEAELNKRVVYCKGCLVEERLEKKKLTKSKFYEDLDQIIEELISPGPLPEQIIKISLGKYNPLQTASEKRKKGKSVVSLAQILNKIQD